MIPRTFILTGERDRNVVIYKYLCGISYICKETEHAMLFLFIALNKFEQNAKRNKRNKF